MKLLLENWRKFINEGSETFPYQIYCDMDGVLVDFELGAITQINKDIKDESITGKKIEKLRQTLATLGRDSITTVDLSKVNKEKRLRDARNYMYMRVGDDEHFWATLPWAPGGEELWAYISKFNPYILTSPMQGEGSKTGKDLWLQNNLTPAPEKVFKSHEKYNWAVDEAGKPNILIDDFTTNTIPWEQAGGIAILHSDTNVGKTIETLERLLNETYT